MRDGRIRADTGGMETKTGRFRRTHAFTQTRRGLKGELLALRYELELLDEALRAGPAPDAARLALDYAFTHLRAAEHAWQAGGGPPSSASSSRRSTPHATRSKPRSRPVPAGSTTHVSA